MTSHYESLRILTIPQIIALENAKFGFKYTHAELPVRIKELIGCDQYNQSLEKKHSYETRHKILPNKPKSTYSHYSKSFLCSWLDDYTPLPIEIKQSNNLAQFSSRYKKHLYCKNT